MIRNADIIGTRYKLLVITGVNGVNRHGDKVVTARCDCGNNYTGPLAPLRRGTTKSCGCLRRNRMKEMSGVNSPNYVHGQGHYKNRTKTYNVWGNMMNRCNNENHPRFWDYGGRGITVCGRWKTFLNFLEDMGEKPEGKSLDRKNNELGYCKENCKWSTPKEQQNNRRFKVLRFK